MSDRFFAIVNPAAGGGRCGDLANATLERVRQIGIELEVAYTKGAGDGTTLARKAYEQGHRQFLVAGGDGTSFEVINGLFPEALERGRPKLAFLPLGTGNSFLRDFSSEGIEHTISALKKGDQRACDIVRLRHTQGELYFLNLLSFGFPADVGELTNRRFKKWGRHGYILGVFSCLASLRHKTFPFRLEGKGDWDRSPCLFLAFSNSKFTGGEMMIAPQADTSDGLIEYVRWASVGRLKLLWLFPRLFTGTHIRHSLATHAAVRCVEFALDAPVNVMVDGEIVRLQCQSIEALPGALDAVV
jgi:diacylglycerol kinase (ATP)